MSNAIPDKQDLLLQLNEQQIGYSKALLRGNWEKTHGNLNAASRWFARFDEHMRSFMERAKLFRSEYDPAYDVKAAANTWLNGLSIYADVLQSAGDLSSAEAVRARILETSERYLQEDAQAEVERGRAAALVSQGRFHEALAALGAARDYFQRHGDDVKQARVTIDLVDLLQWLGDYERASAQLSRARAIIDNRLADEPPSAVNMLGSIFAGLSDVMSGHGDGSGALNAVELYRIGVELDYYRGLIARSMGDHVQAKKAFLEVLPEYEKMGVGPAIEYQIAACELGEGQAEAAFTRLSALEQTFLHGGLLRQKYAALIKVEAEVLLELGEPARALEKLARGLSDLDTYYDPDLLWRLQWQSGVACEALGREANALAEYEAAARTVDSLRKAPLGYRLDSAYLRDKRVLFDAGIALAQRLNEPARCTRLIEMIKSRALTATLSLESEPSRSGDLDREFDDLTRTLDALEFQGFKEGDARKYRAKREQLLAQRAELLEQARALDPRWRAVTEPVPFDMDAIQARLRARNHAALTLYLTQDEVVSVLVTEGTTAVGAQALTPSLVERIERYVDGLESNAQDSVLNDVSASLAIGARHLVPEAMLHEALGHDGLIIIPHGPLHLLPWAALIFLGRRLFEYCPIAVLPNLSCLVSLDDSDSDLDSASPALALLGAPHYAHYGVSTLSPLPQAEQEIEAVLAPYQAKGRIIGSPRTGTEATEANFWDLLEAPCNSSAVLHIVCHGVPEPFEPSNAGLLLADAKVDAAEISRRQIVYEEVVLSACSTGWRPVRVGPIELCGDDILGLPGAFLEAGAKSVLVSIPKANDAATAKFMTLYHGFRAEGATPMAAVQQTQLQMLRDEAFKPFMWVGFTVYGCH